MTPITYDKYSPVYKLLQFSHRDDASRIVSSSGKQHVIITAMCISFVSFTQNTPLVDTTIRTVVGVVEVRQSPRRRTDSYRAPAGTRVAIELALGTGTPGLTEADSTALDIAGTLQTGNI